MRSQARIARHAAVAAFAELAEIYTWRTWTFGWFARLLFQVTFFSLIGTLLGDPLQVRYLLVGNAVVLVALEATIVILTSVGERRSGTLPLLVAAPASHVTVFLGRGLHWLATGMVSSHLAFLLLATAFGVALPGWRTLLVIPCIALVGVAAYSYGSCLAAVVLRVMEARWVALNASYLTLMAICGVNVPTSFWPSWVQALSAVLPVTHGLQAVRGVLAGAPLADVARLMALEGAVAVAWLVLAVVALGRLAEAGRHDGSIEFAP